MRNSLKRSDYGFAVTELLIVVVIIGLVTGAGVYVAKRHKTVQSQTSADTAVASTAAIDQTKIGTASGVDQTNDLETQDENTNSSNQAQSENQTATSANTSLSNVGGAYDENSF